MKKILSIFGTRPEAIKMAPVIKELEKYPDAFNSVVCVTAQHREMLDQVLELFGIAPDYDLDIMQPEQDLHDLTCHILLSIKPILKEVEPDLVLVHGDTTTTMAASLAAYYQKVKIGHVEAGLRTFQKYAPFPEEINRKVAGAVTDIHFAPTERAKKNLLLEGVSDSNIHVTGNTVIDAVLLIIKKIETENLQKRIISNLVAAYPNLSSVLKNNCQPDGNRRLILVTGHRRENFGKGFENICQALITIASKHPNVDIIYPVHLNPNVQEPVYRMLGSCNNIYLIDPIEYLPFVYLMYQSELIITDSGGVQEEAPSFGKPVLVTRDITERPEAIDTGTVKLVGTDHRSIVDTVTMLLEDTNVYNEMARSINPYGDGKASERIVGALKH